MTGILTMLCIFAPILGVYYLTPVKFRWIVLLVSGIIFYASVNPWMLFLLGGSIAGSYAAAIAIGNAADTKRAKVEFAVSVTALAAVLCLFKYFNFFVQSMSNFLGKAGLHSEPLLLKLMMPLGISYYTFKIISYLADVYRGKMDAERHFGYYALYVSFFPQIVSGPIERAEHFLPQIKSRNAFDEALFVCGMEKILRGLFKKLVIADRLEGFVVTVFNNPLGYPGIAAVMAMFFYSIQIYCDFSGYSDIVIGMAEMLGICTKENFHYPYFSRNIQEFWRRWHMSLSSWLRDYIYIPLGGGRVGRMRRNLNVIVTFLISGLWHGSGWNFLVWGGLHGLWNAFSPKSDGKKKPFFVEKIEIILTFIGVTVLWVVFGTENLHTAAQVLTQAVFHFSISYEAVLQSMLIFTGDNTCAAYFIVVCLMVMIFAVYEWRRNGGKKAGMFWNVLFLMMTILFGQVGNSSFLYGQF